MSFLTPLHACSVKGPELINKYVGQSEENVREGKLEIVKKLETWQ